MKNQSDRNNTAFSREQRWVIVSLIFGVCLPLIDATILGVALPDLSASLSASVTQIQWVSVLYTLVAAVTVTVCAWATRQWGAKTFWITGLVIFTLGSGLCSVSPTINWLLVSRAVQGVGAGILMTVMQTVLVHTVGKPLLKTAMATMAVPTVLAPIAGPLLAGYLLHIGDWRMIFYINLPIGLVAIVLGWMMIAKDDLQQVRKPGAPSQANHRFDGLGFMVLAPALILLMFSLSSLSDLGRQGGGHWLETAGASLIGAGLLFLFVRHTRKRGEQSLIRLQVFSVGSFGASMGLLFLSSISFYGGLFALPLMFIQGFGHSEWLASVWVGAHGLGALISRPYLKTLCERFGVGNTALLGCGLAVLGTVPFLWPDIQGSAPLIALTMVLRGAGIGLLTLLGMSHAYHDLEPTQTPDASALSRILTLLGASVGPAMVAILYVKDVHSATFQPVLMGLTLVTLACVLPAVWLVRGDRRASVLSN
ncbi:MFS transporter [Photobacterium atrarenae]|uniref:MFS transporter n=1 Tax=Photobacterium atrarenae TaxID=865757 RepID=A0ABY5GNU4_9GAMM|nr:MFS transporter [Photobacterium atrarenae]UTV30475.1 MFS transporter [Photobacterium atrarenae]